VRLIAAAFFALALTFAVAPAAVASEEHPTSLEIQQELWCDDCQTTLDEANAVSYTPHIMSFIESRIAAGETKTQIKNEAVVKYRYHVSLLSSKSVVERTTLADLEDEVMCPVCNTTLDQSSSGAARQIKTFISRRIAAGDSKNEIKDRLVADYGPQILAAPPKKGFDLLAWLLPIVGVLGGALVLAALAWRWSRVGEPAPAVAGVDPALERRIDQELDRFDEG
jgi:cytochrome c-type biogenesis protein CcmH